MLRTSLGRTPWVVAVAALLLWSCGEATESPVSPDIDVAPHCAVQSPPAGGGSGAIFTTTPDGSIVNENVHYDFKREVYLDGGPPNNAPATAAGLDAGFYVFQITDPPGKLLLSRDPARCRIVEISADGVIVRRVPADDPAVSPFTGADGDTWVNTDARGQDAQYIGEPCAVPDADEGEAGDNTTTPDIDGLGRHDTNIDVDHGGDAGAIVVQMMPYGTTPNPGGVYKAWMTPLAAYIDVKGADLNLVPGQKTGRIRPHPCYDFCADPDPGFVPSNRYTKTDNFKVTEQFTGEIKVRKFHDINANGIWDEGEPEIGVDQFIDENGDIDELATEGGWPVAWTEPGHSGSPEDRYTPFEEVIEVVGEYIAEEGHFPGKWVQSASWLDEAYQYPVQKAVSVTVAASGETHEIRFGNYMPGSIEGTKVIDFDADGSIEEGDVCPSASGDPVNAPGCAGVTVKLTGTDGMGNGVGPITTATNEDGDFSFTGLTPGVYKVEIVEPSGFYCSYPTAGACEYDNIVLKSGDHVDLDDGDDDANDGAAFGDWTPGEKSGVKFEDYDGQGDDKVGTDVLIGGWTIHLLKKVDGVWVKDAEATTAEGTGAYEFTGLIPGVAYAVCEVNRDGYEQGYPGAGFDCDAVEPEGTDYAKYGHEFTLTSGEVHADNNFGNFELVDVEICKLRDGDGLVSTTGDRTPRPGWKVALTVNDVIVDEQYTGDDGCYTWEDLPALPRGGTFTEFGKNIDLPSDQDSFYDAKEETVEGWIALGAFDNAGTFIPFATEVDFEAPPKSGSTYSATFVNTPTQGCTPGFWQGGSDGGQAGGQWLWDTLEDPEWEASGGQGSNPFAHAMDFDAFFGGSETGLTMLELVETGGTSDDARKAARSLVAAYLNASWGMAYAYTTTELEGLWQDALNGTISFLDLHTMLDAANNAPGGCPISASGY